MDCAAYGIVCNNGTIIGLTASLPGLHDRSAVRHKGDLGGQTGSRSPRPPLHLGLLCIHRGQTQINADEACSSVFIRDRGLDWTRNRTESRFAVKPGVGFAGQFKPTEKERLAKRMILPTKSRESATSGHLKNCTKGRIFSQEWSRAPRGIESAAF